MSKYYTLTHYPTVMNNIHCNYCGYNKISLKKDPDKLQGQRVNLCKKCRKKEKNKDVRKK